MATRTITLTDRPPVKIDEDNWPVIASAKDYEHDGQVECQANQKSSWWIKVRQHEDGRTLVYAGYSYDTNWQNARSLAHKHGQRLPSGPVDDICHAIKSVCADMEAGEHDGDDASRWKRLGDECIADLPAEDIDAPESSRSPLATLMIEVEQLRRENASLKSAERTAESSK